MNKVMRLYEVKLLVDRQKEDGMTKQVKENYLVSDACCSGAEAKVLEEQLPFMIPGGDQEVIGVKLLPINEVFNADGAEDKFYKAKVAFITYDKKTMKEKKNNVLYIVRANDFDQAKKIVTEELSKTMTDYELKDITETTYLDLYE